MNKIENDQMKLEMGLIQREQGCGKHVLFVASTYMYGFDV